MRNLFTWKYFKEQTWYYFHPFHNLKRVHQYTKDGDEVALNNYYETYKKEKNAKQKTTPYNSELD